MPLYDANVFDPPAPLAHVTLRHPSNNNAVSNVPMLLDTGADVTLVPVIYTSRLGVADNSGETYELMGFDGNISLASAIRLEMSFLNKTFRGRFLLVEQDWGVMGRDILNLVTLLLDGPNLTWREQRRSS